MEDTEELGQKIRQARLDRGITIDEVQNSTKIRKKYLKAIEAGDFEVISQEVFLKGFLRVYANYVGLDGQEILNEYNRLTKLHQEAKQDETRVDIEEDESTAEKVLCFISNHLMKIITVAVILIMVLSGATILYQKGIIGSLIQTEQSNKVSSEKEEVALTEKKETEKKKDNTSQESVNTEIEANENIQEIENNEKEIEIKDQDNEASKRNITIKVLETSWVKVVIDGKIVLEEMLSSGTERSWHADRNVELLSANAAGVKVVLNDEEFGPFGRQGEVIERKFTLRSE